MNMQICDRYFPTRLWGFSGHIQTIIQGVLSRIYCPLVDGKRYFFIQSDGATVTYDLYHPIEPHSQGGRKYLYIHIVTFTFNDGIWKTTVDLTTFYTKQVVKYHNSKLLILEVFYKNE